MRTFVIVFMVLVWTGNGLADDLTVPNTFSAGTPARAAEVNENFTAVEASVDDNAAAIITNETDIRSNESSIVAVASGGGIMVYSQGTLIGRFLSLVESQPNSQLIWVISNTGYIFSLATEPFSNTYLGVASIYFSEPNCVGNAYVVEHPRGRWAFSIGAVVF